VTSNDTQLTADFWAHARQLGEERFHWISHPVTKAHINLRISGDHTVDSVGHWHRNFLPATVDRALSIGCGFGHLERDLVTRGAVQHVLGIDISEGAVESARATAAAAGLSDRITYEVADVNALDLGSERFDAIFGVGSIHHVVELERLFEQCRRALEPDGLLLFDEYIGVSKWQVSDDVLGLMNSLLERLPARYRRVFGSDPVETRDRMYRTELRWFDENDPSESVRSDEIMTAVRQSFDVVDYRPYGGALLHLLLSLIAGNFDEHDEHDRAMLALLVLFEAELESSGRIGSDFAAVVCRRETCSVQVPPSQ
jgi:SAM-dependent methyltransferase